MDLFVDIAGKVLRFVYAKAQSLILLATSENELVFIHSEFCALTRPPVQLTSPCALMAMHSEQHVLICTKAGELFVLDLNSLEFSMSNVELTPLLHIHGKPFQLFSGTLLGSKSTHKSPTVTNHKAKPPSKPCFLVLAKSGLPVLLISDSRHSKCAGFAYHAPGTWSRILDPLRFRSSEYVTLKQPRQSTSATWELDQWQRHLLLGVSMASVEVQPLTTVQHLESLVQASEVIQSPSEKWHWLELLFDYFARDFAANYKRAKFWLSNAYRRKGDGAAYVEQKLIPRLAKNREYQMVIEEYVQHEKDKHIISS